MLALRLCSARRFFSSTSAVLSGHNKWSKIKQKKGVNDMQKSAMYGKMGREIEVAIRSGGSADPNLNATLANILKKAKTAGVPRDNIEKAIVRASGGGGKDIASRVVYEAMVSGNVGVIMECLTDNGNRTIHKIREILNDFNGRYAPAGFLFDKIGRVRVVVRDRDGPNPLKPKSGESKIEYVFETAMAAGSQDFDVFEKSDIVQFTCTPETKDSLAAALMDTGLCEELDSSEVVYVARDPPDEGSVSDEVASKISELLDALEENEDCVSAWTTIDSYIRPDEE